MQLTDAQSWLLPLLTRRMTPQAIQEELGWSKQRFYYVLNSLGDTGLLRAFGEMPTGGAASTFPTQEFVDAVSLALPSVGWNKTLIRRVAKTQARAGILPPDTAGGRYSRTEWTGHAVRRAEWTTVQGRRWVVHGLLEPREDGAEWSLRTPDTRIVRVWKDGALVHSWDEQRGLMVTLDLIRDRLGIVGPVTGDHKVGLTLMVAWVLESRALLDADSLANATVLGGGS